MVIDPLMAFLPPRVAANLDQCVRQALTPLAELAARTGCAVLFVRHLTKQPVGTGRCTAGQGSMGIVAAVRTALFAAAHPTDPDGRVLAVAKSNLGRRPPALGYRVVESASGQPVVEWTGPVDLTADGLCGGEPAVGLRPRDRAIGLAEAGAGGRPAEGGGPVRGGGRGGHPRADAGAGEGGAAGGVAPDVRREGGAGRVVLVRPGRRVAGGRAVRSRSRSSCRRCRRCRTLTCCE